MEIRVITSGKEIQDYDWLVVFIGCGDKLRISEATPQWVKAKIERMKASGDLPKKLGETRSLYDVEADGEHRRLLLIGCSNCPEGELCTEKFVAEQQRVFATAARLLCDRPERKVVWMLPDVGAEQTKVDAQVQTAATAIVMGPQSQGIYQKEAKRFPYQSVTLVTATTPSEAAIQRGQVIGEAINLTRELINRGPHELSPESFANRASQIATKSGLTCRIFDEPQLDAERMHAMLAVARGSDYEPRMVVLEHRGGGDAPFIGLVGKGVTYDSGGLSLKPSDSMKTMKSDMSGAATVLSVMQAIAELKLPVNVRGYMGLVENMISGSAYRLGDVLTARNGVTIEVMNTDAEGRLVLADVLAYAVDEGCTKLVDLATLTGSCVVALGEDYSGVFTNQQEWCDQLMSAAHAAGEKVWQLPMCDSFNDQLRSDVADCKNVGSRWGGAITAAKFLEKFVDGTPWVHLDIAGPAFLCDNKPHREGGATGVMVRTLLKLVEQL